jgi:hypothetical protein
MTCHLPGVRYPWGMMNQELHQETRFHELDLPDACMACGGALAARFTPGAAHAVCRACRRIFTMTVARTDDGLQIVQLPGGSA